MKPDTESLMALRPLELAAYLRSRGWHEAERLGERASIWLARRGGEELELLLPLDPTPGDYMSRLAEVVSTLEAAEARPRSEILDDIAATTADTVRFRFLGPTFEQHSVNVEHGVHIYENVRELLLAAACAAVGPRPVFSTRKPTRALEYLTTVQLAPPARGSYVVTVRSPVPPTLAHQGAPLPEADEPFERRVISTLATSLAGAHRAAIRAASGATFQPFHDEVASGVSANLCEALAGLVARSGARTCEITVAEAPSRPGLEERHVSFSADVAPVLREAARVFRASALREDFELEGLVIRLERGEGATTGIVTVAGVVDSSLRKVRLELEANDYPTAIEAHLKARPVRCEGELVREGRAHVLRHPRRFVLKSEEREE
ncbi:hypothetical protein [Archangium lipolyticum]|uniref:hypothetical protein n=1 Tax=Archangium lipolyticum TaxID=2970465 RepID=UPI00214A3D3A|nr:hypothetical protein [Archangium lipolyticum]